MWKNTFLYSGLIWIVGLVVGNLLLVPFFIEGLEIIGVAALFSFLGSLIPLLVLVPMVRFILQKDYKPREKAFALGAFVCVATLIPVLFLFGGLGGNVDTEALTLALPYILGLWLGILLGYKRFLKNAVPRPDMEELIETLGNK